MSNGKKVINKFLHNIYTKRIKFTRTHITYTRIIDEYRDNPSEFDINCVDPLNRSALVAAIENENIELIRLLLEENIKVNDALLHAIKEEYVEAVELLLVWEEDHHEPNTSYVIICLIKFFFIIN